MTKFGDAITMITVRVCRFLVENTLQKGRCILHYPSFTNSSKIENAETIFGGSVSTYKKSSRHIVTTGYNELRISQTKEFLQKKYLKNNL